MPKYEVAYTFPIDIYVDVELEAASKDAALQRAREYARTDGYEHPLDLAQDKLRSIQLDGIVFEIESIDNMTVPREVKE